ncbi:MAG: hypothetical protein HY652_15460 [Acidobacteria bacterium]|nr:hypothetical protein [Acidobacteriota bacterium]
MSRLWIRQRHHVSWWKRLGRQWHRQWRLVMLALGLALVAFLVVAFASRFFGAYHRYDPRYYEPKDKEREEHMEKAARPRE